MYICRFVKYATVQVKGAKTIRLLLVKWYWATDNSFVGEQHFTDICHLWTPDASHESGDSTRALYSRGLLAQNVKGGDSLHYWAGDRCWSK